MGIQHFVADGNRKITSFQIVKGIVSLPDRNKDFKFKLEIYFSKMEFFHSGSAKKYIDVSC